MTSPILPMRPGIKLPRLDLFTGTLPVGWCYQIKLDDERGVAAPGDVLRNRHGELLAEHKARVFAPALAKARLLFPGHVLDLALLGFRGHWPKGALVLLDVVLPEPWAKRRQYLDALPTFRPLVWTSGGGGRQKGPDPTPGEVYRLNCYEDALPLFRLTLGMKGTEGVIGRHPAAGYETGDSRHMLKSRWN